MGEFVPKNALYYRRTGALWTDLYHTPPDRLKLVNYRPDLDAKHADAVARKARGEAAREADRRREIVKFRQRRLLHMRRRQRDNREAATASKAKPRTAAAVRQVDGHAVKDHLFYRRRGFAWSDYAQTPDDRLHLVVRPMIVRGDQRAQRAILRRRSEEAAVSEMVDKVRAESRGDIRAAFVARAEENRARHDTLRAQTSEGAYLLHRRAKSAAAVRGAASSAATMPQPQRQSEWAREQAYGGGGGGGSGSGSAFGQPTIVQVTGQPVHIVGGPLRPGQRVGGPALAIVDTTAGVSRRLADGKLLTVFQLSRSVKLFAMLDMFFIVLWSLSIPLLLLAIVLPALGYWGAKNFTAGPVWAYVVFIVLHIMGRVAYVGMAEGMVMWVVLINLLGIMVEAYILRIVWAFLQLLRTCSAAEQHDLREVSTAHHW
uniref:Uncharacterized protein n=1 Tax=Bicosoecida sp. CB-2014 TaxID=1486930 RepID=A0A7S1GAN6_9STRA|mmetsp:Transcript_2398/g.8115  ORF Transcript_2398/g.8115 Transcript_2398/m.8115 type:complete len:430 (+) Transcript_2398:218-1507(+)